MEKNLVLFRLKNMVWIVIHEIKNVLNPTGSHNRWYLQGLKPHFAILNWF